MCQGKKSNNFYRGTETHISTKLYQFLMGSCVSYCADTSHANEQDRKQFKQYSVSLAHRVNIIENVRKSATDQKCIGDHCGTRRNDLLTGDAAIVHKYFRLLHAGLYITCVNEKQVVLKQATTRIHVC